MDITSLALIGAAFLTLIAVGYVGRRILHQRIGSVGFLSPSERKTVLASKHVHRVSSLSTRTPHTVSIETNFKYPFGPKIVVEADVFHGALYLSEPETQRAIDRRGGNRDYPPDAEPMLRALGCHVGPTGLIQYGPVPFSPQALLDGVQYMAQASLSVYALSA
jgi:hypothetical protein